MAAKAQAGHGGRGRSSHGGAVKGRGRGYTKTTKPVKIEMCKDLGGHIFDFGLKMSAHLMRMMQEKIVQ